jgi:hypothetical protein
VGKGLPVEASTAESCAVGAEVEVKVEVEVEVVDG